MPEKLTLNFNNEMLKVVQRLQIVSGDGTTVSDVLREALGFYDWAYREALKGNKLVIVKSNGDMVEILLKFHNEIG